MSNENNQKQVGNLIIFDNGNGMSWKWQYMDIYRRQITSDYSGVSGSSMLEYTFEEEKPPYFDKFSEEEKQLFTSEYYRIRENVRCGTYYKKSDDTKEEEPLSKYMLVEYSVRSTPGGCTEDINVVNSAVKKDVLLEIVKSILKSDKIESINDYPVKDFEFDASERMWSINYEVEGMTVLDRSVYKIIEGGI